MASTQENLDEYSQFLGRITPTIPRRKRDDTLDRLVMYGPFEALVMPTVRKVADAIYVLADLWRRPTN